MHVWKVSVAGDLALVAELGLWGFGLAPLPPGMGGLKMPPILTEDRSPADRVLGLDLWDV